MKLIIIGVVAVVVVAVAGFVGLTIIGPMLFGGEEEVPVEVAQPADAEAATDAKAETAPRRRAATVAAEDAEFGLFEVGPTVEIAERVVNLSGEGPFSVLQVTIVLEFAATEEIAEAGPDEKPALVEAFMIEVEPVLALIEDGINTIISKRSGELLLKEEGKKELKEQIIEVANKFAPQPVIGVYFTKFFLQ